MECRWSPLEILNSDKSPNLGERKSGIVQVGDTVSINGILNWPFVRRRNNALQSFFGNHLRLFIPNAASIIR